MDGCRRQICLFALARRNAVLNTRCPACPLVDLSVRPRGTRQVVKAAGERGLLLLTAGARETIRFLPALTVSEAEIDEALSILDASLDEVFNRLHIVSADTPI
jgi:hypothetical protein